MELVLKKLVTNKLKRVGRGIGSGKGGHTVGKGQKGQGSRGAHKIKITDEGGNVPLFRKLPVQKGFRSVTAKPATVTMSWLNAHTKEGTVVDAEFLKNEKVLAKVTDKAKLVGNDKLDHKITVKGLGVSAGAKKVIEAAGGNVID